MRDAARDDLGDVELRRLERRQRPEDLAGDRRFVGRMRRLQLVGRDDDDVDQHAGHDDVVRPQRARRGEALDLRDDEAAVVAHRKRLIERPENAAFVLVGEIAALVGGGGADDRDVGNDGREEQPVVAGETRRARRSARPRALAFIAQPSRARIDEGVHADLGQHARPLGRRLAMHVEQDAGGHVVGGDRVAADHLPDRRRLGRRRAGGIGAGEHLARQPGLAIWSMPLTPHMSPAAIGCSVVRLRGWPSASKRAPMRGEHRVGAAERRGRRNRDDRAVGDQAGRFGGGEDVGAWPWLGLRRSRSMAVSRPCAPPRSVASATASERTPSSPLAAGAPRPATASWNSRTERA